MLLGMAEIFFLQLMHIIIKVNRVINKVNLKYILYPKKVYLRN